MRPTLDEQLRGLREILVQSVAPAVQGDYPAETLAGVVRALAMLEARAHLAGPFLVWDNDATRALLRDIATSVPIDASIDAPAHYAEAVATADVAALDAENERLRGVLASLVPALSTDPALAGPHAAVVAHLRARIARYPYTSTGSLPAR